MDCQHGNIIINWNKMVAGKMTTIYWKRKVIHSIWIKAKILRTMLLFHFRKNSSFINGQQLSRRNHIHDKGKKKESHTSFSICQLLIHWKKSVSKFYLIISKCHWYCTSHKTSPPYCDLLKLFTIIWFLGWFRRIN